jgi:hypothetical protein
MNSVCVATVVNLITSKAYVSSSDKPWENVTPTLWSQAMITLSIITACIPYLKSVITDLQTGLAVVIISEPLELSVPSKRNADVDHRDGSTNKSKFLDGLRKSRPQRSKDSPDTEQYPEDRKYGYKDDESSKNIRLGHPQWRQNPVTHSGGIFHPKTTTYYSTLERSDSIKGLTGQYHRSGRPLRRREWRRSISEFSAKSTFAVARRTLMSQWRWWQLGTGWFLLLASACFILSNAMTIGVGKIEQALDGEVWFWHDMDDSRKVASAQGGVIIIIIIILSFSTSIFLPAAK